MSENDELDLKKYVGYIQKLGDNWMLVVAILLVLFVAYIYARDISACNSYYQQFIWQNCSNYLMSNEFVLPSNISSII